MLSRVELHSFLNSLLCIHFVVFLIYRCSGSCWHVRAACLIMYIFQAAPAFFFQSWNDLVVIFMLDFSIECFCRNVNFEISRSMFRATRKLLRWCFPTDGVTIFCPIYLHISVYRPWTLCVNICAQSSWVELHPLLTMVWRYQVILWFNIHIGVCTYSSGKDEQN